MRNQGWFLTPKTRPTPLPEPVRPVQIRGFLRIDVHPEPSVEETEVCGVGPVGFVWLPRLKFLAEYLLVEVFYDLGQLLGIEARRQEVDRFVRHLGPLRGW